MLALPSSPEWALARQLTTNHDAWIVGGAARLDADPTQVKDVDLLVPWAQWHAVAALLVHLAPTPNTFGGWSVNMKGERTTPETIGRLNVYVPRALTYDIWPGDLTFLARNSRFQAAWQPDAGVRLVTLKTEGS